MLCNGLLSMCLLPKRQLGIEVIMPMEKMIDITKRDIYERIRYGIIDYISLIFDTLIKR